MYESIEANEEFSWSQPEEFCPTQDEEFSGSQAFSESQAFSGSQATLRRLHDSPYVHDPGGEAMGQ